MKKISLKLIALLIIAGTSLNGFAQSEISNLFKAGVKDLNYVANGYLKPMGTGFAANLGSNWYNTGAPHKLGGFDITVGGGVAMVPTADQSFSLAGLTNLKPTGGQTSAPSFSGGNTGVELKLVQPATINGVANPNAGQEITRFTTPKGYSKMIPGASFQLAIGLPKGTQLMFRYVPTVKATGFNLGLWGLGIQHNFKQWIPVLKDLPFDASVVLAYTKLTVGYDFATPITPADLAPAGTYVTPTGVTFDKQKLSLTSSAFTANVVVSKKLLFFTPYLGFGFTKSKFDLGFKGNFPILGDPITDITNANFGKMTVENLKDPIKISTNNFMPNATIGFRLKILWVLSLHAQYTMQKYPIISGGFGINIR